MAKPEQTVKAIKIEVDIISLVKWNLQADYRSGRGMSRDRLRDISRWLSRPLLTETVFHCLRQS